MTNKDVLVAEKEATEEGVLISVHTFLMVNEHTVIGHTSEAVRVQYLAQGQTDLN